MNLVIKYLNFNFMLVLIAVMLAGKIDTVELRDITCRYTYQQPSNFFGKIELL